MKRLVIVLLALASLACEGGASARPARVPEEKAPRASGAVESSQRSGAPARAQDGRVGLTCAPLIWPRGVLVHVVRPRWRDLQVLGSVVGLHLVEVVDLLARQQRSAQRLFRYEAVLVDVAARVGSWMPRAFHEHVPVRRNGAPALPVRVPRTRVNDAHGVSVATEQASEGPVDGR